MKTFKSLITEDLSMDDFVDFSSKYLKLKDKPNINFVKEKQEGMSSACYKPGDKSITVLSKGRRFMDIARSVAHELVHQRQHERDGADKLDGSTGSPHEDEANAFAGRIIRNYGKDNPEIYTEEVNYNKNKGPSSDKLMFAYRKRRRN